MDIRGKIGLINSMEVSVQIKFVLTGLLLSVTKKEYYKFLTLMFELFVVSITQENNRTGYRTRKQTFIIDLDQFSMWQLTSKPGDLILTFPMIDIF